MKDNQLPNRHTDKQREPLRVPPRMEGVVKNKGTENKKKEPKLTLKEKRVEKQKKKESKI